MSLKMKLKAPCHFKCNILQTCKRIIQLFKFRIRKPVRIGLHLPCQRPRARTSSGKGRLSRILSGFCSLRPSREMDQVMDLKSFSDAGNQKAPYPSPITPAYIRMGGRIKEEVREQDDVQDACRSFEKYLVEMIVEDGKMRDLADVEELLLCWKNLKSPVFIDLVCRFYRELCKDLFSNSSEEHPVNN